MAEGNKEQKSCCGFVVIPRHASSDQTDPPALTMETRVVLGERNQLGGKRRRRKASSAAVQVGSRDEREGFRSRPPLKRSRFPMGSSERERQRWRQGGEECWRRSRNGVESSVAAASHRFLGPPPRTARMTCLGPRRNPARQQCRVAALLQHLNLSGFFFPHVVFLLSSCKSGQMKQCILKPVFSEHVTSSTLTRAHATSHTHTHTRRRRSVTVQEEDTAARENRRTV